MGEGSIGFEKGDTGFEEVEAGLQEGEEGLAECCHDGLELDSEDGDARVVVWTGLDEELAVGEAGDAVDLGDDRLRVAALSSERKDDPEDGVGAVEG